MICEIDVCKEKAIAGLPWCAKHSQEAENLGILKRKSEFANSENSEVQNDTK